MAGILPDQMCGQRRQPASTCPVGSKATFEEGPALARSGQTLQVDVRQVPVREHRAILSGVPSTMIAFAPLAREIRRHFSILNFAEGGQFSLVFIRPIFPSCWCGSTPTPATSTCWATVMSSRSPAFWRGSRISAPCRPWSAEGHPRLQSAWAF